MVPGVYGYWSGMTLGLAIVAVCVWRLLTRRLIQDKISSQQPI